MIAVNQEIFNKLAQEEKPVLLDFWAPWCVYCRRIAPALERLAAQRTDVVVGKVNIDEEPELARREQIEIEQLRHKLKMLEMENHLLKKLEEIERRRG